MTLAELAEKVGQVLVAFHFHYFIFILTCQFDFSVLTHRRNILNPLKLEYLNKSHLARLWSTPEGVNSLAQRAYQLVKEAFPSRWPSIDIIWLTTNVHAADISPWNTSRT